MKRILSVLLALVMVIGMFPMGILSASAATVVTYEKVTTAPKDWSGTYLIVYEKSATEAIVHNGQDGDGKYETAAINNGTIAGTSAMTACEATIATMTDGYSVQIAGQYIYGTSGSNKTNFSTTAQLNTITMDDDGTVLITSNTSVLRFNKATTSGNNRFRYYKSASYSNQQAVCLYAKVETTTDCTHENKTSVTEAATCTTAGATTVTCADCGAFVSETEIPALGHKLVAGEVTAPDCINAGYTTYNCSNEGCDYSEKKDVTEALGHDFVNGICSVCKATEGTIEKASAIAVGDTVVFVIEDASVELTAISTTSTKYGLGTAYTGTPAGTWQWEVVAGSAVGSYAFKNSDGDYLYWGSGNSLSVNASLSENTSWTVTFDTDGNAAILNVKDAARQIWWNTNNGTNPRFACYTGKTANNQYLATQIYKISAAEGDCSHEWSDWTVVTPASCTANGEQTRTCSLCKEVETSAIATISHNIENGVCTMCKSEFYTVATTLNAYDNVVIYYPTTGVALTATASGSKLTGASVSVDENGLAITEGVAVMQAQYLSGSTTDFYLICDNQYLTSGATGNSLTFATEATDYAVWYIEVADETNGLVYIHNRNAVYNGSSQSLEYYNGFTTYGTKTTDIYKFQLFTKAGEVPTCEHVWSDWETVTDATCTTAGQEKSVCTLNCGEEKFQTVPATGHTYIFAETAVSCDVCEWTAAKTNIGDLPNVAGDTLYYFEGIVTYVDGRTVYMEDATGGICVYYAFDEQKDAALGDIIRVCDSLTVYNDLVETTNTLYVETQKVSSGNALPNKTVTVAELLADAAADKSLLGTRVTLNKMTVGEIVSNGNTTVTDANGASTVIRYMPTVEGVAQGSVVNMTAIVSIYKGTYQLYINESTAAQDVVLYTEPVAKIGDTEYTTFADAYADADADDVIVLLANLGTNDEAYALELTKDVTIDANGFFAYISATGEYTIYGMDSTCAAELDGEPEGGMTVTGATVKGAPGYFFFDGVFYAYEVKITHVSLKPGADALGYKAEIVGNEVVLENVASIGFKLWVTEDLVVTKTKEGTSATLRLQGIMEGNGGETEINAQAFVTFSNGDTAESDTHSTTMKETLEYINGNLSDFDADQITAVQGLISKYESKMTDWNIETIKAWTAA